MLAGCGYTPAPQPTRRALTTGHATGPGPLYLIGGGDHLAPLLAHFIELAGGADAPIVIVPFAGGEVGGDRSQSAFSALGASHLSVITGNPGSRDSELAALHDAAAIFFIGGQPDKLLAAYAPFADAVSQAWQAGCMVGGSSAGAMVWGSRVILSGEASNALQHGLDENAGGLLVRPGLGLAAGATVDPHFTQRSRFFRLFTTVEKTHTLGIGIDEDTAAIVQPAGKLSCYGAGTVTLLKPDGDNAQVDVLTSGKETPYGPWRISGGQS